MRQIFLLIFGFILGHVVFIIITNCDVKTVKPILIEPPTCDTGKSPLNDPEHDLTLEERYILKEAVKTNVKPLQLDLSAYNPTKEQCDNDPHITANGSLSRLPRRCAISRDLKRYMNWWVLITCDDGELILLIDDTMNIKFKNRIDIRMPENAVRQANEFGIKYARQDNVKVYPLWSSK